HSIIPGDGAACAKTGSSSRSGWESWHGRSKASLNSASTSRRSPGWLLGSWAGCLGSHAAQLKPLGGHNCPASILWLLFPAVSLHDRFHFRRIIIQVDFL